MRVFGTFVGTKVQEKNKKLDPEINSG